MPPLVLPPGFSWPSHHWPAGTRAFTTATCWPHRAAEVPGRRCPDSVDANKMEKLVLALA